MINKFNWVLSKRNKQNEYIVVSRHKYFDNVHKAENKFSQQSVLFVKIYDGEKIGDVITKKEKLR